MNIRLSNIHSIHFVGIKGIAMSSLAVWAHERGITVTGSDIDEHFPSDEILKKIGVIVQSGFDRKHVKQPDLVVYTGAHDGRDNVEVKEAKKRGIPTLAHGQALGLAMKGTKQISVAGSHGKTTTSAMIATILMHAQKDPSYAIGCGEIIGLGLPGHFGKGAYFVAEADEYITDPHHDPTPRFLWQTPDVLVITNIDYDHPDAYPTMESVQKAFLALMRQQEGKKITIVNRDNADSSPLITAGNTSQVTYGFHADSDYQGADIEYHTGKTMFTLLCKKKPVGRFTIWVPGGHNVLNAIAAAVASHEAGVSWDGIKAGLHRFGGAKRRFEQIGSIRGIAFYDDYAHHPREVAATLAAARLWYPKHRIIVVFQPHTYSRTKSLLTDFGVAFGDSTIAITTEIYGSARETDTLGMSGVVFADEVKKHHDHVIFAPGPTEVLGVLQKETKKGDIVLFMGAGNIYSWEHDVIEKFKKT